jgi:hypothetical protein
MNLQTIDLDIDELDLDDLLALGEFFLLLDLILPEAYDTTTHHETP